MAMPAWLVGLFLLVAVACAVGVMFYTAYNGNKPSDFFQESVGDQYRLNLPEADIDYYYVLREKLLNKAGLEEDEEPVEGEEPKAPVVRQLPAEDRVGLQKALMKRLIGDIEQLDKVQRDKPGNWKLWQQKLVSEKFWESVVEAEKSVGEEIDECLHEADRLESGWKEQIFPQALHTWRMSKQQQVEKKETKKAIVQDKKAIVKEVKRVETEKRMTAEQEEKQRRLAEKAMEALLKQEEEELAAASKAKPKGKAKAPNSGKKKK